MTAQKSFAFFSGMKFWPASAGCYWKMSKVYSFRWQRSAESSRSLFAVKKYAPVLVESTRAVIQAVEKGTGLECVQSDHPQRTSSKNLSHSGTDGKRKQFYINLFYRTKVIEYEPTNEIDLWTFLKIIQVAITPRIWHCYSASQAALELCCRQECFNCLSPRMLISADVCCPMTEKRYGSSW